MGGAAMPATLERGARSAMATKARRCGAQNRYSSATIRREPNARVVPPSRRADPGVEAGCSSAEIETTRSALIGSRLAVDPDHLAPMSEVDVDRRAPARP